MTSGANIKYTPLLSGTLPEWKPNFQEGGRASEKSIGPGGAAAHMGTFPVAYTYVPILDWLCTTLGRIPTATRSGHRTWYSVGIVQRRQSMDGRGRAKENIWIESFWRTIKYDYIYIYPEKTSHV